MMVSMGSRRSRHDDAVLLTGVYGSGKSTMAAEIADVLERHGVAYAAIDLDWLTWFATADHTSEGLVNAVFLDNLAAVVDNYRRVGVEHFVLAGTVRDLTDLDRIRATLSLPVRVIRLVVPLGEIEQRLRADPTSGRRDDLATASAWLAAGTGIGVEDIAIDNLGSIDTIAGGIVDWLGWIQSDQTRSADRSQ